MAAPYKLHGGNSTTRSLRAWNECTKREYAKEGRTCEQVDGGVLKKGWVVDGSRGEEGRPRDPRQLCHGYERRRHHARALRNQSGVLGAEVGPGGAGGGDHVSGDRRAADSRAAAAAGCARGCASERARAHPPATTAAPPTTPLYATWNLPPTIRGRWISTRACRALGTAAGIGPRAYHACALRGAWPKKSIKAGVESRITRKC